MKGEVSRLDAAKLSARYPIDGGVPGWHFRLDETSAGAFEAEAVDEWGRRAHRHGTNPATTLAACVADAQALAGHME